MAKVDHYLDDIDKRMKSRLEPHVQMFMRHAKNEDKSPEDRRLYQLMADVSRYLHRDPGISEAEFMEKVAEIGRSAYSQAMPLPPEP